MSNGVLLSIPKQRSKKKKKKKKKKKTSELQMLHYIFIHSYLIFVNFVDVSFSHVNSRKQTLLVGTHLKWKFKSDWVIRNNIVMTFAWYNESEEYRSTKKKGVLEKKNGITGVKANIQKGNF